MMIVADQDRVEDGDRVIIFNGVTIQELRKFDSDIYCDFPCYGWNPLDIPKRLKIVAEEEDDGDCTEQWGASHQQAEAEAGKLPLGLVAAPAPLTEAELSVLNLAAALSEAELTSPAVEDTFQPTNKRGPVIKGEDRLVQFQVDQNHLFETVGKGNKLKMSRYLVLLMSHIE